MGLVEQSKSDNAQITSNANDFGVSINMLAPNGESVDFIGLHNKHHLGLDPTGQPMNTLVASVTFNESVLLAANPNYPVRDSNRMVNLKGHLVNVSDLSGPAVKNFKVLEWFQDEAKLDMIVVILNDYDPDAG